MEFMNDFTHHIKHFTPLIGILAAGFFGFWLFSFDRLFQIALIIAVGAGYVTWGIIHHHIHKDLHWEVVVEYVVVAFLGIVIVFSLILRA